jgi:hypothetical protein
MGGEGLGAIRRSRFLIPKVADIGTGGLCDSSGKRVPAGPRAVQKGATFGFQAWRAGVTRGQKWKGLRPGAGSRERGVVWRALSVDGGTPLRIERCSCGFQCLSKRSCTITLPRVCGQIPVDVPTTPQFSHSQDCYKLGEDFKFV